MTEEVPSTYLFKLFESGDYSPWPVLTVLSFGFVLAYLSWRIKKKDAEIEKSNLNPNHYFSVHIKIVTKWLRLIFLMLTIIALILLF
jgi:hypothetical protein